MNFEDERQGERRRKSDQPAASEPSDTSRPRRKKKAESPEIGGALRSIYDKALNEAIPDEMLDLLGKLG